MTPSTDPAPDDLAHSYLDLADVILVGLRPDGRVLHINRNGARTLGRPQREIVGVDWFENFLPTRLREETRGIFRKFMEAASDAPARAESLVLRADGNERLIAWHKAAVRNSSGTIIAVMASGEDITEQRAAETVLRRTQAEFRATLEQTGVAIAHFDRNGRLTHANDRLCTLTGLERLELQTRSFDDLFVPNNTDRELSRERSPRRRRALWVGEIRRFRLEKRYLRQDGSIVWMLLTASLVSDEGGKPLHKLAVIQDITRRKQAEELRANEELQRMALTAAGTGAWDWQAANDRVRWSP